MRNRFYEQTLIRKFRDDKEKNRFLNHVSRFRFFFHVSKRPGVLAEEERPVKQRRQANCDSRSHLTHT